MPVPMPILAIAISTDFESPERSVLTRLLNNPSVAKGLLSNTCKDMLIGAVRNGIFILATKPVHESSLVSDCSESNFPSNGFVNVASLAKSIISSGGES